MTQPYQPYQGAFFFCVKLVLIIVIVFVGLILLGSSPAIIAAILEGVTGDY